MTLRITLVPGDSDSPELAEQVLLALQANPKGVIIAVIGSAERVTIENGGKKGYGGLSYQFDPTHEEVKTLMEK